MRIVAILSLWISMLSLPGFAQSGSSARSAKTAFNKATLEAYLRYSELYFGLTAVKIDDPKPSKSRPGFSEVDVHFTAESGDKTETYYISKDGQTVVRPDPEGEAANDAVWNINKNPFQANLDKLHTDNQPAFGPSNAPVTIVEFGDLECPSCRMEAPVLRLLMPQLYANKVRVVFKDFPLEKIHPWARAASDAGRCVFHQNQAAFWKFYDWMYETQDQITPETLNSKVLAWAGGNGLDAAQLGRCMESKSTDPEVAQNIAEGHALNVTGTPTLFINGRKIGGLQWSGLQKIIDLELKHR